MSFSILMCALRFIFIVLKNIVKHRAEFKIEVKRFIL